MAKTPSILYLRRGLLLLLLLLLGGLGFLYWFGRSGQVHSPKVADNPSELPDDEITFAGKEFEYTYQEGGRTLFIIKGKNIQTDRSNKVELDQIAISVSAPSGEMYEVAGKQGTYTQATQEATLQSDVTVRGPSGLEILTSILQVSSNGKAIRAPEPLTFKYLEKVQGKADRFRGDLNERVFILAGNVHVENGPQAAGPFSLDAQRLFLDRVRHHARADADVGLSFLSHRLDAGRINLWLDEQDARIQFVRALQGVRGRIGATSATQDVGPVRFAGNTLTAVMEPEGDALRRFELEGRPDRPATLISKAPGELTRRLGAAFIAGDLEGESLGRAEALGGVKLAELSEDPGEEALSAEPGKAASDTPTDEAVAADLETPIEEEGDRPPEGVTTRGDAQERDQPVLDELDRKAVRLVTAKRADGAFGPDGNLIEITLYEQVSFRDPTFTAKGDQARFDFGNGVGELTGKPVHAKSERADIDAPRLLYTQRTGLLVAQGGTRTQIRNATADGLFAGSATSAAAGAPAGPPAGPVWVEAEEAFFRSASRSFLFRGKVRAWRGENLVLADELKGDEDSGQLTGTGNVRTLWRPEASGAPRPGSGGVALGDGPIEVTAGNMVYDKAGQKLVYTSDVKAQQGQRSLTCDKLTAELDAKNQISALVLEGKVLIQDRATGRTIEGDRARYEPGGKTVTVEGEKVVMKDQAGAQVSGSRVVYDFASGKAQVTAGSAPASSGDGQR